MFLFSPKLFCLALSLAVGGVVGAPVAQGSVNTLNGGRPRPVWVGRATVDHKNDGWAIPRDGDEMRSVNSWNGGTARPVWVKRAAVDVKNDGWAIPRCTAYPRILGGEGSQRQFFSGMTLRPIRVNFTSLDRHDGWAFTRAWKESLGEILKN